MYRFALTAGILAAVGCLSLHAQTIRVTATIPFEFQVGAQVMPAGDYFISHQSTHVLQLTCQTGARKSAMVVTNASPAEPAGASSRLVFHRYGNEYFLAKVWSSPSHAAVAIPPTKRERELIASARRATPASLTIAAK
ncbi:MAG: hypothetical protein IPJ98_29895 [Bryobacterales bacterium]|nr:hypothetical protein [Bryobacterales bacterium]